MATRYWVGGTGTWDGISTVNWSTTSGGAGGASAPISTDDVVFDANSGAAATVTVDATAKARGATVNKSDITLSLAGNVSMASVAGVGFTLTTGTLILNSYTLTVQFFLSSNSNARTIDFGAGKIVAIGSGSVIFNFATSTNLTLLGSKNVEATYGGAVGTRQIYGGATTANSINLKITGGTDTVTLGGGLNDLDLTGFAGTLDATSRTIYGNAIFSSGVTINGGTTTFAATSGPKKITTNGALINFTPTFNGVGGSWELQDNFVMPSTRTLTLTNGTLNANGKNVTVGTFALGVGVKTLTLGSGTWTVLGASWNANTNVTDLTVSASTGTINMTSASAKTFAGDGKTWPTLNQGGAGTLTVQQSNTFANITNTIQPSTITFTAGTTQTVGAFGVSGTAGNLITLNSSSAGSQATLSDSSGINSVSFVSVKDINATGGAIWDAPETGGNVDAGNNVGWNFGIPFKYDIEFSPSLRSFTERRYF